MNTEIVNLTVAAKRWILAYVSVAAVVFVLMMALGLLMRLSQGEIFSLPADLFYQILTAHGIGMVGIASLAGSAIMWYFLSQHVKLTTGILVANLVFFLLGVVFILGAVFIGGFAGLWTFLYPLPGTSAGVWGDGAAASYLLGVLLVGVGFLLLFLDTGRALISKYGGLGRALGWPQLFAGANMAEAPPPAVVASTMVTIINVLAIVVGAAILSISLINVYYPEFAIDALWGKNLIFFFGHVFINATIYMSVIAVYEILPHYTGRPWKTSKPFLIAWTASTLMVLIVYPHHLLMDFAMPEWMLWVGQIISYISGLPVLAVTMVGTLAIIHRSAIRWDIVSGLLVLSVFGWTAGVFPAIIDATIVVNKVMHNTLWVPGHFHLYLLLGVVAMFLGFMLYLVKEQQVTTNSLWDRLSFWCYALGGVAFASMFLISGSQGAARRWAVHLPQWVGHDKLAAVFALIVVLAVLILVVRFLTRLKNANTMT